MDGSRGQLLAGTAGPNQEGVRCRFRHESQVLSKEPSRRRLAENALRIGVTERPPTLAREIAPLRHEHRAAHEQEDDLSTKMDCVAWMKDGAVARCAIDAQFAPTDALD